MVVVAVPVAGLMTIAEQLHNRLGADELALAEESAAGLILHRIPRPSGRERRVDRPCLPPAARDLRLACGNEPATSSPA
jgi:hypothetical protein